MGIERRMHKEAKAVGQFLRLHRCMLQKVLITRGRLKIQLKKSEKASCSGTVARIRVIQNIVEKVK